MRRGAAAGWPGPPRKAGRRVGRPGRCGGEDCRMLIGNLRVDQRTGRACTGGGPARRRRRAKGRRESRRREVRSHKPTRRCATASRETRKERRPRSGAGAARSTRRLSTRASRPGSAHDHSAHKVRQGDGPAHRPRSGAPRRRQAACKGTWGRSMCGLAAVHQSNRTVGEDIARMLAGALPPGIKTSRSNAVDSVVSIRYAARPIMETILGCQGRGGLRGQDGIACGAHPAGGRAGRKARRGGTAGPAPAASIMPGGMPPCLRPILRPRHGRPRRPRPPVLPRAWRTASATAPATLAPRRRGRPRPAGIGTGEPGGGRSGRRIRAGRGPAPARPPVRALPPPCSATERRSPVPAAAAAADGAAAPARGSPPRSCTARGRIRRGSPPAAL